MNPLIEKLQVKNMGVKIMTKQKTKKRMYFHGECVIAELTELPEDLKLRILNKCFYIDTTPW